MIAMSFLPSAPSLSASDVFGMLRRHYLPDGRPAGGIFVGEIESPDGRRRADALWAPWTIAGGDGIVGHEIKVTRSDVLAELADPTKAEPWARYCTRWYLVVAHPSLIDGLDVPEAWGVMSPPSGRRTRTMTTIRPAPKLKPAETGPGWRRIASWEHHRLAEQMETLKYQASRYQREAEYAQRELASAESARVGRASPHAAKVGGIIAELERRRWDIGNVDPDEVIAAIVDVAATRRLADQARSEIGYLVEGARRIAAPMGRIADELARLTKGESR